MCPICGSPVMLIGKLGDRYYYRCRACGMDVSSDRANADLFNIKLEEN